MDTDNFSPINPSPKGYKFSEEEKVNILRYGILPELVKTSHAPASHLTFQQSPNGDYITEYFHGYNYKFKASDLLDSISPFRFNMENLIRNCPQFNKYNVRYVYAELGQDQIVSTRLTIKDQVFQYLNPCACDHITFSICYSLKMNGSNTIILTEEGLNEFYYPFLDPENWNTFSKAFQPELFSNYQSNGSSNIDNILPDSIYSILDDINSHLNTEWESPRNEIHCRSALHYSNCAHYLRPTSERESFAKSPITELLNQNYFYDNEKHQKDLRDKIESVEEEYKLLISKIETVVEDGAEYRNEFTFNINLGKFYSALNNAEILYQILDKLEEELFIQISNKLYSFSYVPSHIYPGAIGIQCKHFWSAAKDLLTVMKIPSNNYQINPRQLNFLALIDILIYSSINLKLENVNWQYLKEIGLVSSFDRGMSINIADVHFYQIRFSACLDGIH